MTTRLPIDLTDFPIAELTTRKITFVIKDENDDAIDGANLTALTATLMDEASGAIINAVQDLDILNTNGGTVDGNGNGAWVMRTDDNAITDDTKEEECHVLLIEWSYGIGPKWGRETIRLLVVNLPDVESP